MRCTRSRRGTITFNGRFASKVGYRFAAGLRGITHSWCSPGPAQEKANAPRLRERSARPAEARIAPGDLLCGSYQVVVGEADELDAVEVSVLWRRRRGDEDLGVHLFERHTSQSSGRFATTLPASPLSYDGRIVKICWWFVVCCLARPGRRDW